MSFNYKNPISPLTSLGTISLPRTEVYGTNFSVLSTGGFMEVYSLNDLYFTIPSGSTGLIEYTGNTIPIQFQKGTGSVFSPDVLTLNSDNISSGRRRLGMLVYVIEQDQIYQYQIPNFESLWTGATSATGPGGPTVVMSDFGTTIKTNSPEGISFVSAWTANTIDGISGETSSTAVWKKLVTGGSGTTVSGEYLPLSGGTVTGDTIFTSGLTANIFSASTYLGLPIDIFVTGGTYSAGTATFTNNTGGTFIVGGFYTGMTDVFVTGGTYSAGTATFINNTGGTFSISGFYTGATDVFVTGGTYSAGTATFTNNTGGTFNISGFYTGATDVFVTGGTYSAGTATFTNNTGGTFNINGFVSADTFTTGFTFDLSNYDLTIKRNDGVDLTTNLSILASDITITGGTYDSNTGTATFTNNTGGTFNVTGFLTGFTDIYVTGGTFDKNTETLTLRRNDGNDINITGFTDIFVTGGTYSAGTATFKNNTGGTFNVSGFYTGATDVFVTGATYNNTNQFTFTNNTGGTFNVSFYVVTGLTINGDLTVTGNTTLQSLSASTITGGTYYSGSTPLITVINNIASQYTGGTATGDYLPLSGGTVTGNTIFTSGLSANTLYVSGLTQTSGITSTGGITFKQITISSSYTATTSDYMIDVTGGTFSVVLPSAVGIQGRLLVVKNNGGGAVTVQPVLGQTIDGKPFVILGETNTIQLASNGSEWVVISYNISTVNSSSGVFEFTGLSIASTTTFNVAPVKGWIVDDTTNPLSPQLYYVSYSGGVHTAIYVTSYTETYVYLTSGGTIAQTNIPLTEQQRRQNIFLGKLGHANKTNIINAFSQPDFVLSPLAQLRDMFQPIGFINGGIYPYANAANLTFATTAGYLYGLGINFAIDTLNPSQLYVTGNTTTTFQYRTQTGGTTSNVTNIDPLNYDVGGVVTSITGTKATNQRVYLVQNGVFRVQYGQQTYQTLAAAIAGIATESFNTFSNFRDNGILIGILSVLSTATDLTDTAKAQFFLTSKFGETIGAAGGVSTTNLQQAYNNSSNPEILTNSVLGALHIKNGDGPDSTATIIEGANSSGTTTSIIFADGRISGTTLLSPSFTANTNGVRTTYVNATGLTATTISATTYQNLPTDIRVTGGTYSNGTATFTNNTGGTFNVTGFYTGATDVFVTGATYNNANQFTFTNNTGGTFNVSFNRVTGLTATTISATTYQNLPINPDTYVTGFTYNNNVFIIKQNNGIPDLTATINSVISWNVNGILTVTGNTSVQGLTATTISATTYQNLPTDIRVTGGTYLSGTTTFTNNTGGTFNVTGFTGTWVNGLINQTMISGSTLYYAINGSAVGAAFASRAARQTPFAGLTGTAKYLVLRINTSQPASGQMTVGLHINASSSLLKVTIAAGSAAGVYSDLLNTASLTQLDLLSYEIINSSTTGTQASLQTVGFMIY